MVTQLRGTTLQLVNVKRTWNYTSNDINAVVFTRNYRKRINLDERLKRCDSIWNLDNEKKIFTKMRGYNFVKEDKEEEGADSKKKHDGEKGKCCWKMMKWW